MVINMRPKSLGGVSSLEIRQLEIGRYWCMVYTRILFIVYALMNGICHIGL